MINLSPYSRPTTTTAATATSTTTLPLILLLIFTATTTTTTLPLLLLPLLTTLRASGHQCYHYCRCSERRPTVQPANGISPICLNKACSNPRLRYFLSDERSLLIPPYLTIFPTPPAFPPPLLTRLDESFSPSGFLWSFFCLSVPHIHPYLVSSFSSVRFHPNPHQTNDILSASLNLAVYSCLVLSENRPEQVFKSPFYCFAHPNVSILKRRRQFFVLQQLFVVCSQWVIHKSWVFLVGWVVGRQLLQKRTTWEIWWSNPE